jgi:hypothetical protein
MRKDAVSSRDSSNSSSTWWVVNQGAAALDQETPAGRDDVRHYAASATPLIKRASKKEGGLASKQA